MQIRRASKGRLPLTGSDHNVKDHDMAEIYIKGKTNGSLVSLTRSGALRETLPSDFNVTGAVVLRQLEIVDEPGPDTFTLQVPDHF
jgi:hypothetical protein